MTADCDMHLAHALAHASLWAYRLISAVHAMACASFYESMRNSSACCACACSGSHKLLFTSHRIIHRQDHRLLTSCCFPMQPEPEKGFINLTAFYVVPNGPQRSSVFFNGYLAESGLKNMPLAFKLVSQLRPKWAAHLFVHNVFDGDSKILRKCPLPVIFKCLDLGANICLAFGVLLRSTSCPPTRTCVMYAGL